MDLKNKTILITGANGFMGLNFLSFVSNQIKSKSIKIFASVRDLENIQPELKELLNDSRITLIEVDFNGEPISNLPEHLDVIVHFASIASPKFYMDHPVSTMISNSFGTFQLLEALKSRANKGTFVFISSSEVYGQSQAEFISEDSYGIIDPTNVRSCYSESKRFGETLSISYWVKYNLDVKIIRPFHTYGPGLKKGDGRVFSDFAECIAGDRNIEMNSDGSAIRSYCFVSDAVRGIYDVLTKGESGKAYNLGNPKETYSVYELANELINIYPEKNLKVIRSTPPISYLKSNVNRNVPDISLIQNLGWNPKVGVKEGFKKLIEKIRENEINNRTV